MDATANSEERPWSFQSGNIALDFANTADWHASRQPEELLSTYIDLVNWSHDYNIINKKLIDALILESANHPQKAEAALDSARDLREIIYRIFAAIGHQAEPVHEDLGQLKNYYSQAAAAANIKSEQDGFSLNWSSEAPVLEQILWPISYAAMDLLLSSDLAKVGQCADDRGCGLLFLDTSRNHSRSWCRMESCGNRAKAQRHYQRNKLIAKNG